MSAGSMRRAAEALRDEHDAGLMVALADWLDVQAEHVASHDCEAHCAYPDGCAATKAAQTVALWVNRGPL